MSSRSADDIRARVHLTRNTIMSNHVRKQSDEDIPNKPDPNGVCADEEAGSDLYDDEDSTLKRGDLDADAGAPRTDEALNSKH